ncbi:MAG: tetratricopeptide repeat protein [Woeseiaceae bacterium]
MTEQRSFLENLMHRRVPQLVGMYVAATWLVIELGDWVTERFNLPTLVTSYVFVAMLVMLPAIILFAYNHGAPGRDEWTRTERVLIPLNGVLALVVLYAMGPLLVVEAATETVQIPDETGTLQEFEVARQGYHRNIIGFFWLNESGNSELDWLSYGLPLMLAHDLNRVSPVITVETPFDSAAMQNDLRNNGHPAFVGEPQGLRLEIARDRRSAALIIGSFSQAGGTVTINAAVIEAESGREIAAYSVSGSDWLTTVDDVSAAILAYLEVEPSDNQSDDPINQHFSASLLAIEHFTNAHIALEVDNDYPKGIAELQGAVQIDPEFAEANHVLSVTHYLNSDLESARETASQALKNSYRLSETSKFVLKANRYIFDGDFDRGTRVVEIWSRVQPNSTDALAALAQLNILRGTAESLQAAMGAYDRLLELDPKDYGIYRQKAEVEHQRGDFAAAADYLQTFLEYEPDSGAAHLQLANVYQALGDLEAAQVALEDAAILSDSPLESELGLARLLARRGLFDEAEERLSGQLRDDLSPQQRLDVLSAQAEVYFVTGQIEDVIKLNFEISEAAKSFMPPMVRMMSIDKQRADLYSMLGRTDKAIALADEITAQLQPPMDTYMHFTYTTIYGAIDDREGFRKWANRTQQVKDQLPPMLLPFMEFQSARLAIWDEDSDAAIAHLDSARDFMSRSMLQLFHSNLTISSLQVILAELYLQAGAFGDSRDTLEEILNAFPANGYAKLTYAKLHLAQGNEDAGRKALDEVLEIWSDADTDYIFLKEAESLVSSL